MLAVIYHKPFYMLVWQMLLETDMGVDVLGAEKSKEDRKERHVSGSRPWTSLTPLLQPQTMSLRLTRRISCLCLACLSSSSSGAARQWLAAGVMSRPAGVRLVSAREGKRVIGSFDDSPSATQAQPDGGGKLHV